MKIYLLIIGSKIQAFASLSRLCKEIKIDKSSVKDKLPFKLSSFRIEEIEVDERI